jgi:hypothetical protein
MTRLLFTLKRQYLQILVVFVFDIENAVFQNFVFCMTGNFPPTHSDMPLFFQSYERQLHECKGLNTRKET